MGKSGAEFVILCRVSGQMRANIIKSHLEAEGIPALLRYESAGVVYGVTVDGLGEVKVLVPADRVDEAREIIRPQAPGAAGDADSELPGPEA